MKKNFLLVPILMFFICMPSLAETYTYPIYDISTGKTTYGTEEVPIPLDASTPITPSPNYSTYPSVDPLFSCKGNHLTHIGMRSVWCASGRIIRIGDEGVFYHEDGRVESIGNRRVTYSTIGIERIGNEKVSYYHDGKIQKIGNRDVWYQKGRIHQIGHELLYYDD